MKLQQFRTHSQGSKVSRPAAVSAARVMRGQDLPPALLLSISKSLWVDSSRQIITQALRAQLTVALTGWQNTEDDLKKTRQERDALHKQVQETVLQLSREL